MQYEDIVYKAGILAMAVRLEEFLTREWEHRTKRKFSEKRRELSKEGKPYGEFLVEEFLDALKVLDQRIKKELKGGMNALFRLRHEIAHPSDRADRESDLRESDFKRTRGMCLKMDATLKGLKKARLPRMGEVMVSCSLSLRHGERGRHHQTRRPRRVGGMVGWSVALCRPVWRASVGRRQARGSDAVALAFRMRAPAVSATGQPPGAGRQRSGKILRQQLCCPECGRGIGGGVCVGCRQIGPRRPAGGRPESHREMRLRVMTPKTAIRFWTRNARSASTSS